MMIRADDDSTIDKKNLKRREKKNKKRARGKWQIECVTAAPRYISFISKFGRTETTRGKIGI